MDLSFLSKSRQNMLSYSFIERMAYYCMYPKYYFYMLINPYDIECKCILLLIIISIIYDIQILYNKK